MSWLSLTGSEPATSNLQLEQADKAIALRRWPRAGGQLRKVKGASNISILQRNSAFVDDTWLVTSMYELASVGFRSGAWHDLFDEAAARGWYAENGEGCVDGIDAAAGRVVAASRGGGAFEFTDGAWRSLCRSEPSFFKSRIFFDVALDPVEDRIVLWGGDGRAANTTLFFQSGKWRKAKKSSPKPEGLKEARFSLSWDRAAKKVLRASGTDVSYLDGEIWRRHDAATEAVAEVGEDLLFIASSDSRTLLIQPIRGWVWRVTEDEVERLDDIETPPGLITRDWLRAEGAYNWKEFEAVNEDDWLFAFDGQRLLAATVESDLSVCALDLSRA